MIEEEVSLLISRIIISSKFYIHITENSLMRHECRRAILRIAYMYRFHIYTTIHLGNWFPFPDPLERRFYSAGTSETTVKQRPQKTWICNIMNIFMTLDQTANEKNGTCTMQIAHVHCTHCTHCTHSLQQTTRTVTVYDCTYVYANYIHVNTLQCVGNSLSKVCVDSSCLWAWD